MTTNDRPRTRDVHVHNDFPGPERRRARVGHRYHCDLRPWRRLAGFKRQADAAQVMGLTRGELSLVECGILLPTLQEAELIVAVLEHRLGPPIPLGKIWPEPALSELFEQEENHDAD